MLRKLRIEFVVLIMVIVAVLLVCAFAAICWMDRSQSVHDADAALEMALMHAVNGPGQAQPADAVPDGAGAVPDGVVAEDAGQPLRDRPAGEGTGGSAAEEAASQDDGLPSIMPAARGDGRRPVPNAFVAVYRIQDGQMELLPESSNAMLSVTLQDLKEDELASRPDGMGLLSGDQLYYMKQTYPQGTFAAIMYAGTVNHWKELVLGLAPIGAAVLVAFLGISIAFSRWALRPVERAWAQQQRFVADASHDLKTPITVILANTSILLDEPDQPAADRERWLQSTRAEAEGMQQLVQDMLLSASVDVPTGGADATGVRAAMLSAGVDGPAGSAGAPCDAADAPADDVSPALPDGALAPAEAVGDQLSAADLSRIAAREALQFESVAFDRCIKISTDVAPEVRVAVSEADLRRLVQILLDNACKYADEGGTVSLALRTDAAARRAQLSVSNTGPGIAAADLLHIFDRFYRADAARTSHEGHGLGLAIARAIVERAGGTIAATSDDRLTTLTATFPVAAL